jgi:hypothetical protein
MKRFKYNIIVCCLLVLTGIMTSCEKKVEIPGGPLSAYNMVYMPQAASNPRAIKLRFADSLQSFDFGADFGGYDYAGTDIEVQFEVNPALVDSFNKRNGTSYSLLDPETYSLSGTSAKIPKGSLISDALHVNINPYNKLILFKDYLLPIGISKITDGISLSKELATTYFVIRASLEFSDFQEMDRTGWSIAGFSTQEPKEGSTNGGLASCVLDNKLTSFWHSKWDGGEAPPPHWLIVDMGTTHVIHGLYFVGRQSDNNGKPKNVNVTVSDNGTDWQDIGSLVLQNVNSKQKYFLSPFKSGRYFKITVVSSYGNVQYTRLAELGAF